MSEIPGDLMHAAVGVKTLLRFTPEREWGSIIGKAILAERRAERDRCKAVLPELRNNVLEEAAKAAETAQISGSLVRPGVAKAIRALMTPPKPSL